MNKSLQVLIIGCLIVAGSIVGFLIHRSLPDKLEQNISEDQKNKLNDSKSSYKIYNFAIPDKINALAKPKNPLDVTLEYGFELSPDQAFTNARLENAVLIKAGNDAKINILSLEKNGVKIELPMISIIGLQISNSSESRPVRVEKIYDYLKVGDKLNIRMIFAGSNISLNNSEIISIFKDKLKDNPEFDLMMKANSMLGIKKLREHEFVKRLHQKPVIFKPEELIITSIDKIN